jgi:hypothetical protein
LVWLAAGNLNGLSIDKCQVLKGRDVIIYSDLGAFEKGSERAKILNQLLTPSLSPSPFGQGYRVRCSNLLEDEASD